MARTSAAIPVAEGDLGISNQKCLLLTNRKKEKEKKSMVLEEEC